MLPGHSSFANLQMSHLTSRGGNFDLITNLWAQPWAVAFMAPFGADSTYARPALKCYEQERLFLASGLRAKIEHCVNSDF